MKKKLKFLFLIIYNENMLQMYEDIGVGYIASVLRSNGFEIKIIGANEKLIDYQEIIDFNPDIIGMPVYNLSLKSVYSAAKEIKSKINGVITLVGGCTPTYRGVEMLSEEESIDIAVKGEGEYVCLELANALENNKSYHNIKGLIYRKDGVIIENENQELIDNLNSLPLPARDQIEQNNLKIALISTSRGCTANCSFCICKLFWKKWRGRCVDNVVNEIENIVNTYGITTFNFIDCSFEDPGQNYERLRAIAKELINRKVGISYFADMRAEFQRKADDNLMSLLKESGMTGVVIGVESANVKNLKLYNKIATVEDNNKVIELFRRHNIHVEMGFIIFNPYTTFVGLKEDIAFLRKYGYGSNTDYFSARCRLAAFYGSEIHNKIKSDELMKGDQYDEYNYEFIDKRIEVLSKYLSSYIEKMNPITNYAFVRIPYFSTRYPLLLAHYKRRFKNNQTAIIALMDAENSNNKMRGILNDIICSWVECLIELAENGWSKEAADIISHDIICAERLIKIADSFNDEKNMLLLKLMRAGYSNDLLNVYDM